MSETDEGSTGFELLDEEPPVDPGNVTPTPKTQSFAMRSAGPPRGSPVAKANPLVAEASAMQMSFPPAQNAPSVPSSVVVLGMRQQAADAAPKKSSASSGQLAGVSNSVVQGPTGDGRAGQQQRIDNVSRGTQRNPDEQSDEAGLLSPQLNADMVWSGLQWGASLLSRVTEKATESVNKVITTLDPQMKPIIFSGGTLSIVVASNKSDKIMPIQDAFWDVFGRATVEGVKAQPSSMAAQPVGFTAGLKAAEDRVQCLRTAGEVDPDVPVVAVEGFVAELSTDRWSELSCVLLQDRARGINLSLYTQATPLEDEWLVRMREDTPPDYPLSWCGFAKTIGEVASNALHCARNEWHERHTGMPRSTLIYQAARSLAYIYQQRLQAKQDELEQQQINSASGHISATGGVVASGPCADSKVQDRNVIAGTAASGL